MSKIFQLLSEQTGERHYPDEVLLLMPPKIRRWVALRNGEATAKPEGLDKWITKIPTDADQNAALRLGFSNKIQQLSHVRPEVHITSVGGSHHYEPDSVQFVSLSGKVQQRPNSVIPAPMGSVEHHPNVQAVAALAGQIVGVKDGSWVSIVPAEAWEKVLADDGGMKSTDLHAIAQMVVRILNTSNRWEKKDLLQRNAVTGLEKMCWIREELDNLDDASYILLNSQIVGLVVRPFYCDAGTWYQREKEEGVPMVDPAVFEEVQASKEVIAPLKKRGLPEAAFLYKGGHTVSLQLPINDGTVRNTIQRHQIMDRLQVGDKNVSSILANMRGYSGLTDDYGRRVQFTLAAVLGLWKMGRKVDVQLETTGDLALLLSSTNKMRKDFGETLGECDVRFIVPNVADLANVNPIMQDRCLYVSRANTTIVVYYAKGLPTSAEKKKAVDLDLNAKNMIPDLWKDNEVVAYMPIYSGLFFDQSQLGDSKLTETTITWKMAHKTYYVQSFGMASCFRGIVSTIPSFSLYGFGREYVQGKWDVKKDNALVSIPTLRYQKFSEWLKKCADDMRVQILAFLNPISRYSPISNLPYVSRQGVTMILSSATKEEGVMMPNNLILPTLKTGTKVTFGKYSRLPLSTKDAEQMEQHKVADRTTQLDDDDDADDDDDDGDESSGGEEEVEKGNSSRQPKPKTFKWQIKNGEQKVKTQLFDDEFGEVETEAEFVPTMPQNSEDV